MKYIQMDEIYSLLHSLTSPYKSSFKLIAKFVVVHPYKLKPESKDMHESAFTLFLLPMNMAEFGFQYDIV